MIAVVTRGHVRDALRTRDLYHTLELLDRDVYVNAWDRYETNLSWSKRDVAAAKRVLARDALFVYFEGLTRLQNVTVHSFPQRTQKRQRCRIWLAPCANHVTAFSNMLSIYDDLPSRYTRIVSLRNDVHLIRAQNYLLPESLACTSTLRRHLLSHIQSGRAGLSFADGSCDLMVGVDAILSGPRDALTRHARHLLARWTPSLTDEYRVHNPHHEFLVVEMAREIGLCPPRATFVHVTKSGGTTLEQGFAARCPTQVTGSGHVVTERDVRTEYAIAVVRDPVDRMRSQFFYWRDGSQQPPYTRTDAERERNRRLFPTLSTFLDAAMNDTPAFRRVTTERQNFTWDQHFAPQSAWLDTPTRAKLVCFHASELVSRTQSLLDALHVPCNVSGIDLKNPTRPYVHENLTRAHHEWLRRRLRRDFELWSTCN